MLQVDKEKLRTTAIAVRSKNNSISHSFGEIQTAVVQMDTVWNGSASQNAIEAYNRLKNTYCSPRSNALESVARVLECIANGYEVTEEVNTSLSDRFM